jgi:2-dehydropantoate 2-reductase
LETNCQNWRSVILTDHLQLPNLSLCLCASASLRLCVELIAYHEGFIMKIVVMGAGGLGGYLGGWLAHTGQEVTFLARGERLRVMREQGLQVRGPEGNFTLKPVAVTENPAAVGPVDLILFCVKTYDVADAAALVAPLVGAQTAVLPVQNGVRHIEQLQSILGADAILGGMTLIGAHSTIPGVVESMGTSKLLEFGELNGDLSPRCQQIETALKKAGVDARAVPNVEERMWWKFAGICGAGVFALLRGTKAQVWGTPEVRELVRRAVAEAVAVAHAKNIELSDSFPDDAVKLFGKMPPHYKPSMLVDLEQGRRLELEAWNGALSHLGKKTGVPTPVNDFVYACLKPYVNGSASPLPPTATS